jgi:carbonic anhydrase
MKKLASELSRVTCISYLDSAELSYGLISGGIKQCILIACSDMAAGLPYVCSAPEANLQVFQNFGHRTNQIGVDALLSESASDLVVYGHTDCKFLQFLAPPEEHNDAGQRLIREHFRSESELLIQQYNSQTGVDENTRWKRLSGWLVLKELQSVLANPQIAQRFKTDKLRLHGWVHNSEHNVLEVFDPEKEEFVIERRSRSKR